MRVRAAAGIAIGVVLAGGVLLGVGVASKVASGQSVSAGVFCCDPTTSGPCVPGACAKGATTGETVKFPAAGYSLSVQATEPDGGFTGACVVPQITYAPQLPNTCFVPGGFFAYGQPDANVLYGVGSTSVTFPAANVARSYSTLAPSYDSYEVLVTCVPHLPTGACPQPTFSVSQSCCNMGTPMISLDGVSATGLIGIAQ